MKQRLASVWAGLVLDRPRTTIGLSLLVVAFFACFILRFELDVSADSLVLENDKDLEYYRSIRARYGTDDYLIITWTPERGMFASESLETLAGLRDRLLALERVESVSTLLDVPLLESPPLLMADLDEGIRTLTDEGTDFALAQRELRESPLYRNRLLSADGRTTAIQVNFRPDEAGEALRRSRDTLRAKRLDQELSSDEDRELDRLTAEYQEYSALQIARQEADIRSVRDILEDYRADAKIHLVGLPMIVADMMRFVRHDLVVFGVGVLVILAILLGVAFRRLRWVLLPLMTAFVTGIVMTGYLGLMHWKVTVVSSNFLALVLIFSLSLSIHLVVRHRELHAENPHADQRTLVADTVRSKFGPCFYTVITTMVAFGSLVVSDIRPVIDFGWFMFAALVASLVFSFTLFPATLMLMTPGKPTYLRTITGRVTALFADIVEQRGAVILVLVVLLCGLSIAGIFRLTVENRFIDYFKKTTEIYQGMGLVDRELGGTTPLDVVLEAPPAFVKGREAEQQEEEVFDDPFEEDNAGFAATSYWYNSERIGRIRAVQRYLEGLPEAGKVLSLAAVMDQLEILGGGRSPDNFFLSILYRRMPEEIRQALIFPYLSEDGNQVRFDVRVYETAPGLQRQALLDTIHQELTGKFGFEPEQVHLTGMMVLYNNMLQSLFRSQILTLGAVFAAILLTFILVFRSVTVAVYGIVPNLLAAALVLGLMGWLSIPLDIMTITIAAITVGIGVDDTIHYVHRFEREFVRDGDYAAAMQRAHNSIGRAMFYTSVTITIGFSILALSEFIPTIHFGLLTAFAMLAALLANFTVLPLLLRRLKPYGPGLVRQDA